MDCRRVRKSQGLALQDARLLDDELSLLVFLTAGQHVRALAVGASDAARGRAGSGTSGGTYLLSKASRYFHPSRAVHAVQKMSETECKPVIRTRSSFGPSMTLVAVVKRKARPWRPWNDLETSCSCVATATRAVPATPSSCEKGDRRKSRRAHVYWGRCGRTVRSASRARVDLVARQPCGRGRHGSRPACPPRPREERAVRKGEDCFRRGGARAERAQGRPYGEWWMRVSAAAVCGCMPKFGYYFVDEAFGLRVPLNVWSDAAGVVCMKKEQSKEGKERRRRRLQ